MSLFSQDVAEIAPTPKHWGVVPLPLVAYTPDYGGMFGGAAILFFGPDVGVPESDQQGVRDNTVALNAIITTNGSFLTAVAAHYVLQQRSLPVGQRPCRAAGAPDVLRRGGRGGRRGAVPHHGGGGGHQLQRSGAARPVCGTGVRVQTDRRRRPRSAGSTCSRGTTGQRRCRSDLRRGREAHLGHHGRGVLAHRRRRGGHRRPHVPARVGGTSQLRPVPSGCSRVRAGVRLPRRGPPRALSRFLG